MRSYWEQSLIDDYEFGIVGAGIVGLSLAAELVDAGRKVLVMERAAFPLSATLRNAGFACFGSPTELLSDRAAMGDAATLDLVERRFRGLNILRRRLSDAAMGYEPCGGYELLDDPAVLDRLPELNDFLRPVMGTDVFFPAPDHLTQTGIAGVKAMAQNTLEGVLNSGKTLRALSRYIAEKGGTILSGCAVHVVDSDGERALAHAHCVDTKRPFTLSFEALCVCTNAHAHDLFPELKIVPARGIVLVTEPVPGLKLCGSYHWEEGFYYFRHLDGRVLLGGGRNLDLAQEETYNLMDNPRIVAELERRLREHIIPYASETRVEYVWAGTMAFGKDDKTPITREVRPRLFCAARMGGMGVALAGAVAADLAPQMMART
jgi:glycine/D-amino acid oxidase-like deaminating enzyme